MEPINRSELMNRYFDIIMVQKNVPYLLVGGFSLILQCSVGLVLVSFYHPFLLAFNLAFAATIWLIWRIWGAKAIHAALDLSAAKYRTVHFLEEMARQNQHFKSRRYMDGALERAAGLIESYIRQRRRYFGYSFRQDISFLTLYALASALLLGIGGSLVVQQQLTLGQLVGAELVLSVVFLGFVKFGQYLKIFYELCASVEELSNFYRLPVESLSGPSLRKTAPDVPELRLEAMTSPFRGEHFSLSASFEAGNKYLLSPANGQLEPWLFPLLHRYHTPEAGRILLGGVDSMDYHPHYWREIVQVVDHAMLLEMPIADYLRLANPEASMTELHQALALVELDSLIARLPDGLATELHPFGHPLTEQEAFRLRLVAALLQNPSLLVIGARMDAQPPALRRRILARLNHIPGLTLLYVTHQPELMDAAAGFSAYGLLDPHGGTLQPQPDSKALAKALRVMDQTEGKTHADV
jgi:putative ABC transport system ATP-binding protein